MLFYFAENNSPFPISKTTKLIFQYILPNKCYLIKNHNKDLKGQNIILGNCN